MKRKITAVLAILLLAMSAQVFADKLVFTEFGVSYGKVFSPSHIPNSPSGLLDTAIFEAKVGADLYKWADIYVGGAFDLFADRANLPQNYSFFPLFGGVAVNIMPDWAVYPSLLIEYGRAISSRHLSLNSGFTIIDSPWLADYYNYGVCLNWKIEDIAILTFSVERPAISNLPNNGGEIHIIKTGFAWKIFY